MSINDTFICFGICTPPQWFQSETISFKDFCNMCRLISVVSRNGKWAERKTDFSDIYWLLGKHNMSFFFFFFSVHTWQVKGRGLQDQSCDRAPTQQHETPETPSAVKTTGALTLHLALDYWTLESCFWAASEELSISTDASFQWRPVSE